MRAVSPETEGTAFFMGWMGEAAHKAIRTCTTVCVGLYFLMCQPALPYLQVRTNVSTRLHERICKFAQTYLQICTNVSASLHKRICKFARTYLQVCTTISASLRYRMRGLSEDRDRIDQPQRYTVCIRLYGSHSRGGFL